MKDFDVSDADAVIKALDQQGAIAETGQWQDTYRRQIAEELSKRELLAGRKPVRHSAYRAPAGGAIVRGTFYQGGKMIPDLEGEFANPPQQETPMPQPPKTSMRDRLKAKFAKKEPLVVSYARGLKRKYAKPSPEAIKSAMDTLRKDPKDMMHRHGLADMLEGMGRRNESKMLRDEQVPVAVNPYGKVVSLRPVRQPRMNVSRRTRGIPYDQLDAQLTGRQNAVTRIGNNREIRRAPDGESVEVLLHGNHIVTAHPGGDYTLFTRGWRSPTTFSVHQQVAGFRPYSQRGRLMLGGQPFVEGQRYDNHGLPQNRDENGLPEAH